jgi:hypothetical protein
MLTRADVDRQVDRMYELPLFPVRVRWLKRALYMLILLKCVYWVSSFTFYFGEEPVSMFKPHVSFGIREIPLLLYDTRMPWISGCALAILIAACLWRLFMPAGQMILDFVIWLLVLNIHYKVYATLTGGDNLINQLLFFNVLLGAREADSGHRLRTFLHNVGFAGVTIQVCLVYMISALTKLSDEGWRDGTALLTTAGIEHYRNFPPQAWIKPEVWKALNYAVIAYQLLFSFLIWIRPLKKWLLVAGVIMHLYIAFGMGLVLMGITMIIAYIPFWPISQNKHSIEETQGL